MSHWSLALARMGACKDAVKWAATQPSRKRAWDTCERGDWMLWIAARSEMDRKLVVAAACACARLSLKHVKPGEERARIAIETAEAWCRGEATIELVRSAAYAADAAAYAAYAAAYAAAAYAADAADAAASAASAARSSVLKECADICRRMLPMPNLPLRKRARAA